MASRRLRRIVNNEDLLGRLEKHKIFTCHDLLANAELDLIQLLDVAQPVVRELLQLVSNAIIPPPTTILEMSQRVNAMPTTLEALDRALRGGIRAASLTEIVGPAGVGKTQFCHQMVMQACLPPEEGGFGGTALYLDTESAFSPHRLVEMLSKRNPKYSGEAKEHTLLQHFTQHVLVYRINNTSDFMTTLDSLEEVIIDNDVKLLVIDSIASIMRRDFEESSVTKRQGMLATQASLLKRIAESFNIPVIVTNQVTTISQRPSFNFDKPPADAGDKALFVTAALGIVWAHAVNTRLVLEFKDLDFMASVAGSNSRAVPISHGEQREKRCITIAKSPISAVRSFSYCVDSGGIKLVATEEDDEEEEEAAMIMATSSSSSSSSSLQGKSQSTNFWERAIASRSSAAPGLRIESQHHNLFG